MIYENLPSLVDVDKDELDHMLYDVLKEYRKMIENVYEELSLQGKNIEVANVKNASYQARYDEIRTQLKMLMDVYEVKIKKSRSQALKTLFKFSAYDCGSTERERLIDADPTYLKYKQMHIDINDLYNRLMTIVDAFKARAYSLNNLVKIRVASLQDITLYED